MWGADREIETPLIPPQSDKAWEGFHCHLSLLLHTQPTEKLICATLLGLVYACF